MTKSDYVFVARNNCERVARGGVDNSKLNRILFSGFPLLLFDRLRGVDKSQSRLLDHAIVFLENLALEDCETLLRIVRPAHIRSCFIKLQTRSAGNDAVDRHFKGRPEEKSEVGFYGKGVNLAHPLAVAAARYISCKRCVDIAICEHDGAGFERWNDVALSAVGKVSCVEKRKCCWSEKMTLLCSFRSSLDQG